MGAFARIAAVLACGVAATALAGAARAGVAYSFDAPPTDLTSKCSGQNAEVEQATDPVAGYVYESWMGCSGIAFARSSDGGKTFSDPINVPGSVGSGYNSWDPAVAVGPDGTVYAAFMLGHSSQWYPVVATSFDHGKTFSQVTPLVPPDEKNWGDRDFLAVGPDGSVYLTYDYGPNRTSVTFLCAADGSCGYASGDVNVVMQKSTDHGKTFSAMTYVSPGFPASGGDLAPLVVEPNGAIDLIYQGYGIIDSAYDMTPAYEYFMRSTDGGATWTPPTQVAPGAGTMSLSEWWIDTSIGVDAGGNLYDVWDTQGTNADGTANDIGWLSYSINHGKTWSAPIRATPDSLAVPHIMEVVGGPAGTAYVGNLSDSDPNGYGMYLRTFSLKGGGWQSPQTLVSTEFGDPSVWPGDTFGISALAPGHLVLSWGSATPSVGNKKSDIFARGVTVN